MNNELTPNERHLTPSNRYYFTRDMRPEYEDRFTTLNQQPPNMTYPNLDPPHQEDDKVSTIPVFVSAEVCICNGERTYYLSNTNIDEMSPAMLKEILIELMNEAAQ